MVISVINEKGGSGKTTLAINLAGKLALAGDNVVLIDADPQNSTEVFSSIRSNSNIEPLFSNVAKTGDSLGGEIKRMRGIYDSIVVDTGGRDNKDMRKAMIMSDILIIPTVPAQLDVTVLDHMLDIYSDVKVINEGLICVVVINRASPNPMLVKEKSNLQEYIISRQEEEESLKDIIFLDSIIHERQAYKRAVGDGKIIDEYRENDDKAVIDFTEFYEEMLSKVKERILN